MILPDQAAAVTAEASAPVQVWMSTADGQQVLSAQTPVTLGSVTSGATNVVVDDSQTYQTMDGFGAAFTDSSTYLLGNQLSGSAQAQALSALFDPASGIGLSFMRLPMAASDFTACQCMYSYDDVPAGQTDSGLSNFSISHDTGYTIPVIKQAMALNPALKLFANPWSPPAWMKTNDSMVAVADGGTPGTLISSDQGALAQYFVKFLDAYQAAGVPIWGVTPQNEPGVLTTDYPGEAWDPNSEASFVGGYLAPALKSAGLSTAILGYDSNWNTPDYPGTVQADPTAGPALSGIAWHGYAGSPAAMTQFYNRTGVPQYETECSTPLCGSEPAVALAMQDVQNQSRSVVLWNLALDPSGGPKQGTGCTNCTGLLTVDPASDSFSYTANYAGIGQFSKFVRPGAVHIGSTQSTNGLQTAAFRNPDGTEALVVWNPDSTATQFTATWNDRGSFGYSLPAGAIATFVTTPPGPAPLVQTTYALANRADGNVLSTQGGGIGNGTSLTAAADTNAATQQWTLSVTGDGYYRLAAASGGRVIDDTGFSTQPGTQMQIWDMAAGTQNQQWWAEGTDEGYVTFINRLSGLALTDVNGTVTQQVPNGSPNEQWQMQAVPVAGTGYRIVDRNSGLGLGIPGGTTNSGDPVEQFHDSGNPDQHWTLNPAGNGYDTLLNANSGLVAGVAGGSTQQLADLVQWPGNGNPDQSWKPARSGRWVTFTDLNSGQELGVDGASLNDAAHAVQFPANGAMDHQWQLVPLTPVTVQPAVMPPDQAWSPGPHQVVGTGSERCLDINGFGTADGTLVQLWDCSGNWNQQWTLTGGQLVNPQSGKCLDVAGGAVADGTQVRLWTCNGSGAQQWQALPSGDLVNTNSGRCLDVTGWATANGSPVEIWDCGDRQSNQTWMQK